MATSALVCINLKTRVKSEGEDGGGEGREKELGAPNTQQLVQALVDNGIIQLNHKATIRVIDNSKPDSQDLADFKTLNLGTFAVKQSPDTRSGILLETVGDGESGEQKVVSLVQNRPILVQRNLVLQGPVLSKGPGLVHLVQESPPPLTPTPPNSGAINVSKSKKILDSDSNRLSISYNDVESTIPTFTGDGDGLQLTVFIERLEATALLCNWSQAQKLVFAKRKLKGSAGLFIRSEKNIYSWEDLCDRLVSRFPAGSRPIYHRDRFKLAGYNRHYGPYHHEQRVHGVYGRATTSYAHHMATRLHPPLNANGEPIKLPENLESLPKAEHFPTQRHRWNTNEEIAAILICFERHLDWQSKEVKIRPKSGSMLLYSRKKVRYRRDGYCWKKRKDGKTTREDHMKLKVQGTECIYGCYVHSAILPTFHRRCYWLLQNPDIVLVHYLNVPYPDDNKIVSPSLALCADKKQWTKEELVSQLKPMFYSEEEPDANNELEISTAETVETIVSQLLARQRSARTAAICKQLECGCPDSTCADAKTCSQPIRRITSAKPEPSSDSNQVSSTTGSGMLVSGRGMVHGERAVPVHHIHPNHQIPHGSNSQNGAGTPLVLSLSQLQAPGSLLILNSNQSTSNHVASLVTQRHTRKEKHQDPPMELENNHCQISQPVAAQMRGPNIQQQQTSNTNVGDIDKHNRLKYRRKQANKTQVKPYLTPQMKDMGGSEYYETLDLSQEDIQQTLSANMPLSCTQNDNRDSREEGNKQNAVLPGLEIDFIDVNTSSQVDDDVFVNLDAFDMLSEFPDLEGLDHNHNGNNLGEPVVSGSGENGEVMDTEKGNNSPPRMDYREGTANITDYSPEWAYTEGGVKVLVTGPWYSTTSPYTVLFDSCPVPTTLVQSGVLRCFCPAHEAGMVTLQVACEGFVISNSAMFEYKRLPPSGSERATEVSTRESQPHDSLLRFTLMQRLDAIDNRLDIKQEPQDNTENTTLLGKGNFEEKLMNFVQKLSQRKWKESELVDSSIEWCESYKGMTLLHLSASLGYSRLVCMLIKWRTENPAPLLELEVDGLNQDSDGFTPLMRACEKGQSEMSQLLYEWLPASASLVNTKGDSALEIASKNGHTTLAQELQIRLDKSSRFPIAKQLEDNDKDIDSLDGVHTSLESLNSSRDDGIFLHPSSLNRSDYGMNMELHVNIPQWNETRADLSRNSTPSPSSQTKSLLSERLVKRPSVDSGIQLQSSIDSLPSIRASKQSKQNDIQKMSRFDRSMSLPLTCHSMDSGYDLNETLHSSPIRRMDFTLCEVRREGAQSSPESVLLNQEDPHLQQTVGEQDVRVLTLAEQIIAAMPERIKNESEGDMMMMSSDEMEVMSLESPLLLDEPPSSTSSCCFDTSSEFNFDHNYRYCDVGTPCSSLSPASCLPSPPFPLHRSPSPPPTTADFCEFLQASNSTYFEKDFSNLTLSDREQRELYEAAKVIQKAYRSYKGRKKLEQDKERQAAVLIQNYYRRYKQYAYFKQMTRAAMVIQNGYRSYCENKRFKKNQEAAVRIQNCYRNYRDQTETAPTGLKRTYSQRRQHQAARKIQQFMRQSKNNLWEIDPGTIVAERASRKREAGPMQGVPSKLAVLPFHITNNRH